MKGRFYYLFFILIVGGCFLAACGGMSMEDRQSFAPVAEEEESAEPPAEEVMEEPAEIVVTHVVVEGEPIEVTRIIQEEAEVLLPTQAPETESGPLATQTVATGAVATKAMATETAVTQAVATQTPAPTMGIFPSAAIPTLRPTPIAAATHTLSPQATATSGPIISSNALIEERTAELEWPERIRLGETDVVRLSVLPAAEGAVVSAEFPDHDVVTATLALARQAGYDLAAAARLNGLGLTVSPAGDQVQDWRENEPLIWRWVVRPENTGRQRLVVQLILHWKPQPGNPNPARQATVFSKALDVRVTTLLGLTTAQIVLTGFVGLFLGIVLNVPLIRYWRTGKPYITSGNPNQDLIIEPHPNLSLGQEEEQLLRILFTDYSRLTLEFEFRSGYSGARTFLARPIAADERADAYTIAKIGEVGMIRKEYDNYRNFVEHTLPPVTARIQNQPVTVARPFWESRSRPWELAALRYTFIGEPGHKPRSLRLALLDNPAPDLIETLFRTFGPNWWMQRRPYTFRLMQEYDRKLPSHYILEPATGNGRSFDGRSAPDEVDWKIGDLVRLSHFSVVEYKDEGKQLSIRGEGRPGAVPLRIRWLGSTKPNGSTARVIATRASQLQATTIHFDLHGLPDPLAVLPDLLSEQVNGTKSIIHGDLNLENVLVGPGDFVWLIDFASTREGHPLFDMAHLGGEIIAHVITPRFEAADDYLALIRQGGGPLLSTLEKVAGRCLFDINEPREYQLALYMSCMGALKYENLSLKAKYNLYLTAAALAKSLDT